MNTGTFRTGTWEECKHANGRFTTIKMFIFKRVYFVCTDCGELKWIKK